MWFREQECSGGIGYRVRMLQAFPSRLPAQIDAREEPTMHVVPHRRAQEGATLQHEALVPLTRHSPIDECEGDGRARCMLEGLVMRSDRAPPVIEIDQEPAI